MTNIIQQLATYLLCGKDVCPLGNSFAINSHSMDIVLRVPKCSYCGSSSFHSRELFVTNNSTKEIQYFLSHLNNNNY